jgi:hypothetical protein
VKAGHAIVLATAETSNIKSADGQPARLCAGIRRGEHQRGSAFSSFLIPLIISSHLHQTSNPPTDRFAVANL